MTSKIKINLSALILYFSNFILTNARAELSCGLHGNLELRKADCARTLGPELSKLSGEDFEWSLISLSSRGKKYWIDEKTKIIWSPAIKNSDLTTARNLCQDHKLFFDGKINFKIPSELDFFTAHQNKISNICRDIATTHWTDTPGNLGNFPTLRVYDGNSGKFTDSWLHEKHSVRCISF